MPHALIEDITWHARRYPPGTKGNPSWMASYHSRQMPFGNWAIIPVGDQYSVYWDPSWCMRDFRSFANRSIKRGLLSGPHPTLEGAQVAFLTLVATGIIKGEGL